MKLSNYQKLLCVWPCTVAARILLIPFFVFIAILFVVVSVLYRIIKDAKTIIVDRHPIWHDVRISFRESMKLKSLMKGMDL